MTTCTFQKFVNVTASQVSALMRLVGSEHNTGVAHFTIARRASDGLCYCLSEWFRNRTYRHISILKIEPSKDMPGTFTVEVRVNTFLEPATGETTEVAREGCHWSIRENDREPSPVPRSIVLAMHDTLGIFLTE